MQFVGTGPIDPAGPANPPQGGLRIGGILADDIAARFGTPAYVFEAEMIRTQLAAVIAAFDRRVKVLYATKANPNAAVARVLRCGGAGCEVASAGEILVAIRAGFIGSDIQFAGPGKTALDIDTALENDVELLNIESFEEYAAIAARASALGRKQAIAIRVNPPAAPKGCRGPMVGASSKFGVDSELVEPLARRVVREGVCELRGLHAYAGTQCFDAAAWLGHARWVLDFAADIERAVGAPLSSVNFGGGFGVAAHGAPTFDLQRAGTGLASMLDAAPRPDRRYYLELGRYLVADAGVYLTRVTYTKPSRGRTYLILDGGMHHHAAATGLGSVIGRPHTIVSASSRSTPAGGAAGQAMIRASICGPLCTPIDEFAVGVDLPAMRAGDLVAVLGSGAYGLTFSNTMFLSHPSACEILVDGGQMDLVRDRGGPEDAVRGQRLPRGWAE